MFVGSTVGALAGYVAENHIKSTVLTRQSAREGWTRRSLTMALVVLSLSDGHGGCIGVWDER